MHRHSFAGLGALLALVAATASAREPSGARTGGLPAATAGVLAAGEVRPVHRDSATHRFEALADGGRIEMQRAGADSAAIDQLRHHLRTMSEALATGDLGHSALAQLRELPGIAEMAARKGRIEYVYRDLPRGAELRLVTTDPEAVRAIHQLMDHGTRHHPPHGPRHHPPHGAGGHPPHGAGTHPPHDMGGGHARGG